MRRSFWGQFALAIVTVAIAEVGSVEAGRAEAGIKVKVQHAKSFDFAKVRTWSWHPDAAGDVKILQATPENPKQILAELDPTIRAAVEAELARRGLTAAAAPTTDLQVNYYVLIGPAFSTQQMGQFLAAVPEWGLPPFQGQTTSVEVYEQGTLVIDLASTALRSVIWRGSAQAKIDRDFKKPQRDARLRDAIARMFKKYPK